MSIAILCPTRGRPEMFQRLLASLSQNSSGGTPWRVTALIDNDDPKAPEYVEIFKNNPSIVDGHFCGDRPSLSAKLNMGAAWVSDDIMGICDDDIVCETMGWDLLVSKASHPDNIWCYSTAGSGEAFFIGRGIFEFLGYITPPQIGHYFAITWTKDICSILEGGEIGARFVEIPDETDDTHQWLLRDGLDHINKDASTYAAGAAYRKILSEKLKRLKDSVTPPLIKIKKPLRFEKLDSSPVISAAERVSYWDSFPERSIIQRSGLFDRRDLIRMVAQTMDCPRVLEIGVDLGDVLRYCHDVFGRYRGVDITLKKVQKPESSSCVFIYTESDSMLFWRDIDDSEVFDLIFVDGNHDLLESYVDMTQAMLRVSNRGCVLVHDVNRSTPIDGSDSSGQWSHDRLKNLPNWYARILEGHNEGMSIYFKV